MTSDDSCMMMGLGDGGDAEGSVALAGLVVEGGFRPFDFSILKSSARS